MKKKFNLLDMLSDTSKSDISRNVFSIEFIDIDKIKRSKENFYAVNYDALSELRDSILLEGLQQNLVVRKEKEEDYYSIISGERRYTALKLLVEEGHEEHRAVPCKVEYDIDDIRAGIQLIFANSTSRIISDYEKMEQAARLKGLLKELKKSGVELPGKLRGIVADALDVSETQIARLDGINKNITPEFKEAFKENKIGVSVAAELASMPEAEQQAAYEEYQEKGGLEIKDVKRRKDDKKLTADTTENEQMEGQIGFFGEVSEESYTKLQPKDTRDRFLESMGRNPVCEKLSEEAEMEKEHQAKLEKHTELQEELERKLSKEYDEFLCRLKIMSIDRIIESSRETAFKADLCLAIREAELTSKEIEMMLPHTYLLEMLYQEWNVRDDIYMETILDSVYRMLVNVSIQRVLGGSSE